jgi:hypothetical protein
MIEATTTTTGDFISRRISSYYTNARQISLESKYCLTEIELGRGSSGVVVKGKSLASRKDVAVKIISKTGMVKVPAVYLWYGYGTVRR